MARRSATARVLAPVALLGALAAVLVVIGSGGGSGANGGAASTPSPVTGSATTTGETTSTGELTTTVPEPGPERGPRFYTVREGDVLSSIADRTGVGLDRIEKLNPDLDAQTLQTGQRIKLRP